MISKHELLDNKFMTKSVNLLSRSKMGTRALVSTGNLHHQNANVRLIDFFDIVITENLAAHYNLGFSDILFYQKGSAYDNGIFIMNEYEQLSNVMLITNFNAIKDLIKLKRRLNIYNLNYIPTSCAPSATPTGKLNNELNETCPGIHLAMILGCSTIYYDGKHPNAITLNDESLATFLNEKKSMKPINMLISGRLPFLKGTF